jgi:allantoinase
MMKAISSVRLRPSRKKVAHASKQARVDFALYGTIDPEEGPARIPNMV